MRSLEFKTFATAKEIKQNENLPNEEKTFANEVTDTVFISKLYKPSSYTSASENKLLKEKMRLV